MTVIQAVTAVEVLMNLWFRAVVEDENDEQKKSNLLRDLDRKIPLEQGLSTWPKNILGTI